MNFEEEFSKRYIVIKNSELNDLQLRATRIEIVTQLAEALIKLSNKGDDYKNYEENIINYMNDAIKLIDNEENNYEWAKGFLALETKYLDDLKFFLVRKKGYVLNHYTINIIAGVILDIPLIIFLKIHFPIMTLTMILIKYIVIQYKKRQGKLLHY